ncbi:YihY/virulence factor BrkB family protein [Flagellimonas sp. 389]|uniref:YihY/virulence factor BrkB family protein n=1 Tax=Flagellimonas sp. 389 TaxID=2835862 RepID=UPI001BD374B6|nr:YihY/virulence factor BrkB family protein [Flagellimonas sp. 389]MBS9464282.1 YihY/virulence factor BrkB family protein [Flagellimonas sp. 389]
MQKKEQFRPAHLPNLLAMTYRRWIAKEPFRLSAVVAYYAVLSLPGLLVIIVNLVGLIWGAEIVQGALTQEITNALGSDTAQSIQNIIVETRDSNKNGIATILGIATLIYGATGVFYHLQLSLNEIWNLQPNPKSTALKLLIDRAKSFAFILAIGFLLLISFFITAAIAALRDYLGQVLPDLVVYITFFMDIIVSLGIITVLFALMFKYMPDTKVLWKTVRIGAIITGVLFLIGKTLIGFYFSEVEPDSTYGAAGTIVLILLWVSYACLILFFGAQFTNIYAQKYGLYKTIDTALEK